MRKRLLLPALVGAFVSLAGWSPAAGAPAPQQPFTLLKTKMTDQRWAPASVLLADGRTALIAGGYSYSKGICVASGDLFDEKDEQFHPCAGKLNDERDFATATLLASGNVLIAGGFNTRSGSLDTVEIYQPKTQMFLPVPDRMTRGRELFQATRLADGCVLLTGGLDLWIGRTQRSAEIFSPKTETFTPTASPMIQGRFGQASVRLVDGRVLVVGGVSAILGQPGHYLASAEIFDPKTGRFHSTRSPMHSARNCPTATLLTDGTVLIAGGQDGERTLKSAELFDPRTDTFVSLASHLHSGRMSAAAVRLPNGDVLIAGGWNASAKASLASTELYDPKTRQFSIGPALPDPVLDSALIAFPDGLVLSAGGKQARGSQASSLDTGAVWQSGSAAKSP